MRTRARLLCSTVASGCVLALVGAGSAAATQAAATTQRSGTFIPAPVPSTRAAAARRSYAVVGSTNWSGYAQAGKKGLFTSVTDSWKVPTVSTSTPGSQYASDWIGVGGFSDRTLVQTGTESDNIDGTASYDAWYEILPAAEVEFPNVTVHAGDSITAVVSEVATRTWLMELKDTTTGQTGSKEVSYKSSGKSVEAIHERTTICDRSCSLGDFAATSNVTFDPGTFTSTLQRSPQPLLAPALTKDKRTKKRTIVKYASVYDIEMVNPDSDNAIATPSSPNTEQDGFTIADGSNPPAAPS